MSRSIRPPVRAGKAALLAALALACVLSGMTVAGHAEERRYMVAAADPHAALAGIEMLAEGGNAVDAAVAVQAVLGLVEPQSSGIGGGAFLLHYDAAERRVRAYDGRETAPASAGTDLFLGPDGEPMEWDTAVLSGRSVGTPGVIALLWKTHEAHGRLPWARLFDPAIRLARDGFRVSERLAAQIAEDEWLKDRRGAGPYFYPSGDGNEPQPLAVGAILRNPDYADTLARIAAEGPAAFYVGPIAESIVAEVAAASPPGGLTLEDLARYEAKEREPVCAPYRAWRVCGMPPPTSGGVATLSILGLLEPFDMAALDPGSAAAVHLVSEASRLAFADRDRFLADTDFIDVPIAGLLARDYLAARSQLIDPGRSMGNAAAGEPAGRSGRLAPAPDGSLPSTSHFSIVDADGSAVSMTTTIEGAFGAHLMVSGFLLNNQLTDFSFVSEVDDVPVANRVEGGKRPRSSMSPTIVLDGEGRLVAALGSPGGSRIIGYVAKTLVAILDWDLSMQDAVALPHHINRNGATELEADTALAAIELDLAALGHEVRVIDMGTSGLHGIMVRDGRLEGGADPRRGGVVLEGVAR